MNRYLKWLISTTVAGIIAAIATVLVDYAKEKPILTTLKGWCISIVSEIFNLFNFNFKLWWLLIFLLVFLILRYFYFRWYPQINNMPPLFLNYTADSFTYYIWKWNWVYDDLIKKWDIESLHPICEDKKCRGELEYRQASFKAIQPVYICKKCNSTYRPMETPESVARRIIQNVNSRNFKVD